jgi:outer membrane protein assembly factor BamB
VDPKRLAGNRRPVTRRRVGLSREATSVAAAVLCLLASASAQNWVNHGGNPQRNGLSGVPGPHTPTLLWQGSLPSSFGQPVLICDDKLVTYRDNFSTSIAVCHDLVTGDTLWTLDFPGSGGRTMPIGFRDNTVYMVNLQNSAPDTLYALAADDGSVVWRCPCPVSVYLSESATFADNGDLILPLEGMRTARINRLTGDTVWTTERVWPVSGSADVTVSDSTWYCFGGALVGGSLRLYAFDLATGRKRDSVSIEDTHPGGTAPYGNIMVGPDRVLYAHRCGDNVTAVEDTGDSLHIRWVYALEDSTYSPFAQLACGPDSLVYALASGRVIRLDPQTGAALDSSPHIKDSTAVFAAHLSVGADGTVYATNGGYADGALFAFTPSLSVIWVASIPNVSTSCPALGADGELAIAGGGTTLMVFRAPTGAAGPERAPVGRRLVATPNPFRTRMAISLQLTADSPRGVQVFNAAGQLVRILCPPQSLAPKPYSLSWDGRTQSGEVAPDGVYIITAGSETVRAVKAR